MGAGPGRTVCSAIVTEDSGWLWRGDQLFHLPSQSRPPSPERLPGFIKSPRLTITLNFIAFTRRRVLFPAAKVFYVPWALPPRPPSLFLLFPAIVLYPAAGSGGSNKVATRHLGTPALRDDTPQGAAMATGRTVLVRSLCLLPLLPPTPRLEGEELQTSCLTLTHSFIQQIHIRPLKYARH